MELVTKESQVNSNLSELDNARYSGSKYAITYQDLIKRGRSYLIYITEDGLAYGPSRFIGYVGNKIQIHHLNKSKDGRETTRALNKIYGQRHTQSKLLGNLFDIFCTQLKIKPSKHRRRYWITRNVEELLLRPEIPDVITDPNLSKTEKWQFILGRIGQNYFRTKLIDHWGKCSVSGCSKLEVLKASHIKPWSDSTSTERLDVHNGLLLTPNLDTLFDKGYITFDDEGKIMISSYISNTDLQLLNCSTELKVALEPGHHKYMSWHRNKVYEKFLK